MNPSLELLKVEFREFCTSLYKNQIHDIFTSAGFNRVEPTPCISGERRSLVSDYYASVNWELTETVYKFLKVVEAVLLLDRLNVSKESKDSLRSLCNNCGFEVDSNGYTIHITTKGVAQPVKNLIFAANGPKPEIIISDSVSNEIKIIKNEEYCLVYDQPIKTHGLLWKELIKWWKHLTNADNIAEMVAEDRKLKLAGYEVYRFGGYELQQEDAEDLVKQFFIALFRKHKIIT